MPPSIEPPLESQPPREVPHPFRAALVFSLLATAAMAGLSCWAWRQLPAGARVPMHWNASGVVDGFGGPGSLFIMPGVALGISLLLALLPRIEPRRGHLLRSSKAYKAVWFAIVIFFGGLHMVIVYAALGHAVPMDRFAMGGVGAIYMVIGNFLGKVRSNFAFGVRTPWSLSSELSWNKTNRFAGRLFFWFGVAMLVAVVARVPGPALVVALVFFSAIVLVTVLLYSYYVWRQDRHKSTVGGNETQPSD
jgi:uncharacterized membrane protein